MILYNFFQDFNISRFHFNQGPIDVIRNSANVGFPQLILWYKQTLTVIAAQCPAFHKRVTKVYDYLPFITAITQSLNCKNLFVPQNNLNSGVTLLRKMIITKHRKDVQRKQMCDIHVHDFEYIT